MLSMGSGAVPGATSNPTSSLTRYVPFPVDVPATSKVSHVPPPVTSSSSPTRNLPEPVRVIFEPSLASAEAIPPAERVPVAKSTLMMSHRNRWSPSRADLRSPSLSHALNCREDALIFDVTGAEGRFPLSHARARPTRAMLTSPATRFCVFIALLLASAPARCRQKIGCSRQQEGLELWIGLQQWGERSNLNHGLVQLRNRSSANRDNEATSHLETSN